MNKQFIILALILCATELTATPKRRLAKILQELASINPEELDVISQDKALLGAIADVMDRPKIKKNPAYTQALLDFHKNPVLISIIESAAKAFKNS